MTFGLAYQLCYTYPQCGNTRVLLLRAERKLENKYSSYFIDLFFLLSDYNNFFLISKI